MKNYEFSIRWQERTPKYRPGIKVNHGYAGDRYERRSLIVRLPFVRRSVVFALETRSEPKQEPEVSHAL